MSDLTLLSLLWIVPLAGAIGVLFIPKRAEMAIKGTALAITIATMLLTLVALAGYLTGSGSGSQLPAAASLRERAAQNTIATAANGDLTVTDAPGDLVARLPWI